MPRITYDDRTGKVGRSNRGRIRDAAPNTSRMKRKSTKVFAFKVFEETQVTTEGGDVIYEYRLVGITNDSVVDSKIRTIVARNEDIAKLMILDLHKGVIESDNPEVYSFNDEDTSNKFNDEDVYTILDRMSKEDKEMYTPEVEMFGVTQRRLFVQKHAHLLEEEFVEEEEFKYIFVGEVRNVKSQIKRVRAKNGSEAESKIKNQYPHTKYESLGEEE